jgi:hypothetical protein
VIAEIEDAMIAAIEGLGLGLRAVASVPAVFGEAEMKARARQPGAFVAFMGGEARKSQPLILDANFSVFYLVDTGNELQRRRGVTTLGDGGPAPSGGAYLLIEIITPAVHGLKVPGGTLLCTGIANLFADELDRLGVSLYSANFTVPIALLAPTAADLAELHLVHADWLMGRAPTGAPIPLPAPGIDDANAADAADNVSIPQGDD